MTVFNIRLYLLFYLVAVSLVSASVEAVYAADRPDVEINNSALEEYSPPPMFGSDKKPALSRPLRSDWRPGLTVEKSRTYETGTINKPVKKESLPTVEELLNVPRMQTMKSAPVLKKQTVVKRKEMPDLDVPVPPRKVLVVSEELSVLPPVPDRKPPVKRSLRKKPGLKSSRNSLILERPPQNDVPRMPAVPAGRVNKEVLYSPGRNNRQNRGLSLEFQQGVSELNIMQKNILDLHVALIMDNNPTLKLSISSFALPADETISSARRISLSRALSARSYLVDKGIDPSRIKVRALGSETKFTPVDRIDIAFSVTGD